MPRGKAKKILSMFLTAAPIRLSVIFVSAMPIIFSPPLMDVRFWFTQNAAAMNYSVSGLAETWQTFFNIPGRFVPFADYLTLGYSILGHKFLQTTHLSPNIFEYLTRIFLFVAIFVLLRNLISNLLINVNEPNRSKLINTYLLIYSVTWGLGMNIFWKFNGSVAYPILIYTAIAVALVFAIAILRTMKNLSLVHKSSSPAVLGLAFSASMWANFFYEISYITISIIAASILVAPISGMTRSTRLKITCTFVGAFSAVWVPMRLLLNSQCEANLESCYTGSQVSIGGMFGTLLQNIINPLPFADYDAIHDLQVGRLPFVFSGFVILFAVGASLVVSQNLHSINPQKSGVGGSASDAEEMFSAQWRLTLILLAMGISASVIMSVSVRAQDLVDWGLSYRHTPILWMGYVALLLLGINWLTQRISSQAGGVTLVLLVVVLSTGQWGRSWSAVRNYNSDFEPVSRLYHEMYNADLDDSGMANVRRCLIIDELSSDEINTVRYIDPAQKFMMKFHQIDFCKR